MKLAWWIETREHFHPLHIWIYTFLYHFTSALSNILFVPHSISFSSIPSIHAARQPAIHLPHCLFLPQSLYSVCVFVDESVTRFVYSFSYIVVYFSSSSFLMKICNISDGTVQFVTYTRILNTRCIYLYLFCVSSYEKWIFISSLSLSLSLSFIVIISFRNWIRGVCARAFYYVNMSNSDDRCKRFVDSNILPWSNNSVYSTATAIITSTKNSAHRERIENDGKEENWKSMRKKL